MPSPPRPRLSHFTYVVTRHRSRLSGLDPAALSSAMLGALLIPTSQREADVHEAAPGAFAGAMVDPHAQGQQAEGRTAHAAAEGCLPSAHELGGRTYDLVMLLRHLCQLNPQPPAGRLTVHCRDSQYIMHVIIYIVLIYIIYKYCLNLYHT
jgi:hypothetical protein